MIKQFSAGDITIRPFNTFKNWKVQSLDSSSVDAYGYSTYYNQFCEINEGKKISSIFYPTGSPYYSASLEPINPSGKYARNIYSLTDSMFYGNGNQYQLFGVEKYGGDFSTGQKEVRTINDRVVTLALNHNAFGDKVRPNTVHIVDNSNVDQTYDIYDDGATNLFISGSHFSSYNMLGGVKNLMARPYYETGSIKFYITSSNGSVTYLSLQQATEYKNAGKNVLFEESSLTWSFDDSYSRNYFQPENEHFGESVSSWFKYIAVGSSMDQYSLSTARQGYAALFKYDDSTGTHRLMKKFYCPFTQNGLAREFSSDSSLLISIENNNFLMTEQSLLSSSYLEDSFGYSVSVKDDFLAIGSPTGSVCVTTLSNISGSMCYTSGSYPGFVYVYDKNKGGIDNWGIIEVLTGNTNNDKFGYSVSLDNDLLVVGSPGVSGSKGGAYVYRKKIYSTETGSCNVVTIATGSGAGEYPYYIVGNYTWVQESFITSSVWSEGDNFGWSVSVDSGSIVVGTNKSGEGYASVFTASFYSASIGDCPTASWSEIKILRKDSTYGDLDMSSPLYATDVTSTEITSDGFGKSVCISWPTVLVGCIRDKAFIPYSTYAGNPDILGSAYFYRYTTLCGTSSFYQVYKTFGNRKYFTNNRLFGSSVSVEGNFAAVSSWADKSGRNVDYVSDEFVLEDYEYESTSSEDPNGVLGRVAVYNYSDILDKWEFTGNTKINKDKNSPANLYGYSVSVSSDFLAVGAPLVNFATSSATASIYDQNIQIFSGFPANYSGSVFVYPINKYETSPLIGNVFYKNGYFVLTNTASNYYNIFTGTGSRGFDLSYQGSHTIYEHEHLVSIRPGEFNYSTNPTSLVQSSLLFDVNQDGIFDFLDVDLIMRYLQKRKFFEEFVFDDNGLVLEQDTLNDYSWWNSDILQLESEDVLLFESDDAAYLTSSSFNAFTKTAFDYIQENLVNTGLLDVDGDGKINLNDGNILSLYYFDRLVPERLDLLTNENSTRKYVKEIKEYLNTYCRKDNVKVSPYFLEYQYSSSYDPTGSYLAPFITTIGLYQGNELVAIGKLGRPVKNLIDWPLNIVVRFDT
jgi:hypothetical protein